MTFPDEVLFWYWPYHQVHKEEIFKFCQSTGARISVMHRPRTFLLRRPEPHAPACEGAWSTFRQRASTSNLPWCRLATLHLCLCHPSLASAFFGVFVSVSPLNSLSGYLWWLPLHPESCTCLRKCSSTLPIMPHLFFFTIWSLTISDPRFFFFQPRSEAVLGLSSIQTYFVLQISRYNY